MAPEHLQDETRSFAEAYAELFASPHASSSKDVGALAAKIGAKYRPGVTFFTEGNISRFSSHADAALQIETEMRKNIASGLGTCLKLEHIENILVYSESSAVCWLRWTFFPSASSDFASKTWTFVNIYGYRAAIGDQPAGWEYVVRDHEVCEMRKATGKSFND